VIGILIGDDMFWGVFTLKYFHTLDAPFMLGFLTSPQPTLPEQFFAVGSGAPTNQATKQPSK
jgi:hypothetical protein